jgi:CRP/FNR family transcriptional regulator, cyclic AMP receptor protein
MAGAPVESLRRVPLFAELDPRQLDQVARLFKERRFAQGETVTKEGLGGAAFFLIDSGEAAVTVAGAARASLGPGDYFGEIALIDEGARSATITATTDLVCFGLTLWEFRPLVQANGEISWKLMQALVQRLRAAEQS